MIFLLRNIICMNISFFHYILVGLFYFYKFKHYIFFNIILYIINFASFIR